MENFHMLKMISLPHRCFSTTFLCIIFMKTSIYVLLCFFQALPLATNIKEAYKQGRDDEQIFIQNLALFLCTYLKEHSSLLEKKPEMTESLMEVCHQQIY